MGTDSFAAQPAQERTANESGLTRADGLWFEDCGLIIQAEKKLFRVSRDYLAAHSPIFRDMFLLPPPKDADMMDGCPFVLLPDSAEDVTIFLKVMMFYDFFEPYPAPTTYEILTGVLRMSHKYEVAGLRKRALIHISSFHPTTLREYDGLAVKSTHWSTNFCIEVLVLARELSIDWILPMALYRVCKFADELSILDGKIGLQEKVRVITACRILEATAVTEVLDFLWPAGQNGSCPNGMRCSPKSRFECRRIVENRRVRSADKAPFMPLDIWKDGDWDRLDACAVCLSSMKAAHQKAKQTCWDSLPKMFSLPEWNELEKTKAEALK